MKCKIAEQNRETKNENSMAKHTGDEKCKVRNLNYLPEHISATRELEKYKVALEAKYGLDMLDELIFFMLMHGQKRQMVYTEVVYMDLHRLKELHSFFKKKTAMKIVEIEKEIRQELVEAMTSEIAKIKRQSKEEINEIKLGMKCRPKRHRKELDAMIRNMLREVNLPNSKYPS
ncbi:30S ribosomal protein S7, partial [Striga asiatica]